MESKGNSARGQFLARMKTDTVSSDAVSTTKHTPGPWSAIGRYVKSFGPSFLSGGREVCAVSNFTGSEGENEANARLIAAAPELLESLTQTVASLEYWFPRWGDPGGANSAMMNVARAAIAKATGGAK